MTNIHRLRRLRIMRNWRQEDLAEQLGVSVTTVQRWERGSQQPTLYYRAKLCDLFETSAQELGLLDDEPQARHEPAPGAEVQPERAAIPEQPSLWAVPYPRNPYFTGREELLAKLEQHLVRSTHFEPNSLRQAALTQSHVLKGLGGVGKTQTAIEYAYRARDQGLYRHILWITAASEEAMLASFAALHEHVLTIQSVQEWDQHIMATRVIRWLEQCPDPWLLIVDNADDLTFLTGYLPVHGYGSILLTTRSSAVGALASSLEVEPLGLEDGVRLFLRRSQRSTSATLQEQEDARMIVQVLGQLPLAIDQAGAYVEETGCHLHDYLQISQQHQYALLARRGMQASGYPDTVATTWTLSFERIEATNPAAAECLRLCAFVAPDQLPEELLAGGAAYWPETLREAVSDQYQYNQLLETLLAFSLIKRVRREHMLSLHRLVQVVQRALMTPEEQRQWAERLLLAVHAVFPRTPKDEEAVWPQCQRLLAQARICDTLIEEYHLLLPEAVEVLERTAIYLSEHALYSLAEPLYLRALHISEQMLGPEHLQIAAVLNGLAHLYFEQGKYAQAEPLRQRALHILEQLGAEEYPHQMVIALNGLAFTYAEQGKYAQAEPLYLRALRIWEQQVGTEHPQKAFILHGLANLYADQGKYTQAEQLYRQALCIREELLGPHHLRVAYSLNNLAFVYAEQGKYAQAEPLYLRALRIREQRLGPEHLKVAIVVNGLANLYAGQYKYEQAESLYQRTLHIWRLQERDSHPQIAKALNGLANLYHKQGRDADAELLYQRALRILEQHLGPEHPYKACSLIGLAAIYYDQGRYTQAETLCLQAHRIWEEQLGPEHPNMAYAQHGLALLSVRQGFENQAETLFQRALCIREQQLDPAHLETSDVLHDFAWFRRSQGRLSEATSLYQRALDIREKHLGSNHPLTVEARIYLQETLLTLGEIQVPSEVADKATVPPDHVITAQHVCEQL